MFQMGAWPHCDIYIRLMHEMVLVELDHLRQENSNLNQKLKKYECQITQLESEKNEYKEKYEQLQKILDGMQNKEWQQNLRAQSLSFLVNKWTF